MNKELPSLDQWLKEANRRTCANQIGMYLIHCGIVRRSAREAVRGGVSGVPPVMGMIVSCDFERAERAAEQARSMTGVFDVQFWLNEGQLQVGDVIMYVMVGGDIRPNTHAALEYLVEKLKTECITEIELLRCVN